MLYRVEHLRGYTIRAIDGDVGTVDDILFDDRGWVVRYVVADTGGWLSSRRVLLSPSILDRPDRMALALPVRLTREKVLWLAYVVVSAVSIAAFIAFNVWLILEATA